MIKSQLELTHTKNVPVYVVGKKHLLQFSVKNSYKNMPPSGTNNYKKKSVHHARKVCK